VILAAFVPAATAQSTVRVSVSSSGEESNAEPNIWVWGRPVVSADGRFVVFTSSASNLVPGDTNDRQDIFVRDLLSGTTERVSLTFAGGQATGASIAPVVISDDGHTVLTMALATNLVPNDTNGAIDVFKLDLATNAAVRVSRTQAGAQLPSQSFVAQHPSAVDGTFTHAALCAIEPLSTFDTNGAADCYLVPM